MNSESDQELSLTIQSRDFEEVCFLLFFFFYCYFRLQSSLFARGITLYVVVLSYIVKDCLSLRLFLLVRKISASVVQCVYCR